MSRITRLSVALVTILAVAGVGALGMLLVVRARDDTTARAKERVRDRARVVSQVVRDAVREDLGTVAGTARRTAFYLGIVNKLVPQTNAYLSELLATHPRLVTAAVYDGAGRLVARIPRDASVVGKQFSQQEYFRAARTSSPAHISSLITQLGAPKVAVIPYSIRINYRSRFVAVLAATTPITGFDELLVPYTPLGWTVRVYDQAGERISPSAEASGKEYTTDPWVGPALKGGSSVQRVDGTISAAEPVADYGWAVVVSQPAKEANADLRKVTTGRGILAGGAFLLALIAAAIAWSRRAPAES